VLVYAVLRIRHISKHLTMLRPGFGLSADGSALDAPCLLNHSSVAVEVRPKATASKAACRDGGSDFPRFSARRSIPAQAVELKKNRCGIEPVSSTCDNEHTLASLGHSEILGVEDSPRHCSLGSKHATNVCPLAPWWDERIILAGKPSKETPEGVVLSAEDAGDVLPEDDAGGLSSSESNRVNCIGDLAECQRQVPPRIVKGPAQAGYAECLTGCAAAEQIGRLHLAAADPIWQRGHVA
jgi:hypothetical protein